MGGNVVPYAVPRTVLSRISRYRRRSFVGSTSSPLRVHPPPILRAKFWIIFFFSLRFDTLVMVIFRWKWKERGIEKRSGKFLVELMRRRDTKNHANES